VHTSVKDGRIKGQPCRFRIGHGRHRWTGYTVDLTTGCWNWNGFFTQRGYCSIQRTGIPSRQAHRMYYEAAKGAIPEGWQVDHVCRNRRCVNPDHLEAVTPAENSRRRPTNKLTREKAELIRRQHEAGLTQRTIAAQFGIDPSAVSRIVSRQLWAD